MTKKISENIKESEIEEALVANLEYLRQILKLDNEIRLIARQLKLGEHRIDLLITHGNELCLIELKITNFIKDHIQQLKKYIEELIKLQNEGSLIKGDIKPFLLVVSFNDIERDMCESNNITIIKYEPIEVMLRYYEELSTIAPFLKIKPNDYGVFNIGLINRVLKEIARGILDEKKIALETKLSKGSVHNHLKIAQEFSLVRKKNKIYFLTDLGDKFIESSNDGILSSSISDKQAEILKQFIAKDPFYSSTVFGIYCVVESAFILSRNKYPISFDELVKMFIIIGGKTWEWQSKRSKVTASYTFLNYAIQLGLLGKMGSKIVITPSGFRFILMLQLHKSIEMIESISVKK